MMTTNINRIGNFTSSEIYKLLSEGRTKGTMGAAAITYIEEKNMERILGRSIGTEVEARPLQWGKCCEDIVFEELSTAYIRTGDTTFVHPRYDYWAGSPDVRKDNAVGEIKCPLTMDSFFRLVYGGTVFGMVDGFEAKGAAFKAHSKGKQYLCQTISNAAILEVPKAEFIVFMPKKSQLDRIRENACFLGYNSISYCTDEELPYLPDDHPKAGVNIIEFDVTSDLIAPLENAVIEGGKLLIERPKLYL